MILHTQILRTIYYELFTTNCLLRTIYYELYNIFQKRDLSGIVMLHDTTHIQILRTIYYELFITNYLLRTIYYELYITFLRNAVCLVLLCYMILHRCCLKNGLILFIRKVWGLNGFMSYFLWTPFLIVLWYFSALAPDEEDEASVPDAFEYLH